MSIRSDIGLVAILVLITALIAHTIIHTPRWPSRVSQMTQLFKPIFAAALIPTLPLSIIAYSQGFLSPFLSSIFRPLTRLIEVFHLIRTGTFVESGPGVPAEAGKTLARIPMASVWKEGPHQSEAILTYMPLVTLGTIFCFACFLIFRRNLVPRSTIAADTIGVFAILALACSAFPQFFFFRPDVAHLSQFMPGFLVLAGVCLGRCLSHAGGKMPNRSSMYIPNRGLRRLGRAVFGGFLIFHIGFYTWFGLDQRGAGSIALSHGRTEHFRGANGIDVTVSPREKTLFTTVTRIVEENVGENDILLCFPYCPGFNVMTNRGTFAKRLYVDDALLTRDPGWQQRMIERIKEKQPPLIIIQNWAINRTEISRFPNWATQVMDHIASDYILLESFGSYDFYTPDSAQQL